MWYWVLALLACMAGLAILLLALLHVRYRGAWQGEWTGDLPFPHDGSLRVEFGFPGFMRAWTWKPSPGDSEARAAPKNAPRPDGDSESNEAEHDGIIREESFADGESYGRRSDPRSVDEVPTRGPAASPSAGPVYTVPNQRAANAESPLEKKRKNGKDPHRARKSLFHFVTDRTAWAHMIRYGFRVARLIHRLFRPRINVAVGHPDPALLGRLAGRWYAVAPLLPLGDTAMNFRFQDRRPSLRVNVEGGFSALSLLFFGIAVFGVFPFFGLGRRAWRGWRQPQLTGWRAWAYRHIQSL